MVNIILIFSASVETVVIVTDSGIEFNHRAIEQNTQQENKS